MLDLTIAIPVKNEAANLPACLEAIGQNFARAVVVIDSGSTDGTARIASDWGARCLSFEWDGKFPKKRNWFLRNHRPDTKWVLFLDADEWLTPDFKRELAHVLANPGNRVGFWISYSIYFLGRPLRGGYPLRKLALFRVGSGEYERIDEARWSQLDMEIHEHPVLDGPVGVIRAKIDHRETRGLDQWAAKHAEYADWEARRYIARKVGADSAAWTLPQKIKYKLMDTPFLALAFFFGCYFLMLGFRDGYRGLAWAILKAGYFAQVYGRIQEIKMEEGRDG
ncbi:MAG: glycosyltransferase [Verrucomicrobia bacterium]|jgi:glycosyltransferase involved in cell wall biosynthesis|nr:glycosyltransferase [Verrucomicrobiota bacterium]